MSLPQPSSLDIAAFYDADPRRRESPEVQFGDGWTRHDDPHATYRLSWVVETGELYTVREPHPGGLFARYLDQLNLDQADVDELQVQVLGRFATEDEVQAVLDGWPEAMVGEDSLLWVDQRLAARTAPADG